MASVLLRKTKRSDGDALVAGTADSDDGIGEKFLHTILDDPQTTAEARAGRRKAMLRAVYAEFIGTTAFFLPTFAVLVNNYISGYSGDFNRITSGVVNGVTLVCMIMCFSGLSGAIFNPAITFSLWLVRKLSNRKCILFIIVQMMASIFCMFLIYASFPIADHNVWESCVMRPPPSASSWNVFFTEFICTFILTYAAFAMAFEEAESLKPSTMSIQAADESDGLVVFGSTPQSKAGFAPFAIGFIVFALSQYGGGSGTSMNPVRLFGPAIMTGVWDSWAFYVLGEFLGASAAALLCVYGPQSGERAKPASDRPRTSTMTSNNFPSAASSRASSAMGSNAAAKQSLPLGPSNSGAPSAAMSTSQTFAAGDEV